MVVAKATYNGAMARNYLEELFEKAKKAAQNVGSSVKRGLQNFNEVTPDERNAGRNWAVKQGFKPTGAPATQSMKITDAVRQTSQNVVKDFGDMFRNSKLGGNRLQPVRNMVANTGQTVGSGVSGATMNLMNFFQKPTVGNAVRQGAGGVYNVAKVVSAGMPIFQAGNIATQLPQGNKFGTVPRLAKGFIQGMSGVKDLSPEVAEKRQNFFGMEFDPAVAAGEMAGFVKNPFNSRLFKATEGIKLAPFAEKIAGNPGLQRTAAKVANFLTTNSIRGSIEDVMMSLDELPEGASVQEQISYLAKNGLMGAISENVGRGFFKGTEAGIGTAGQVLKGQADKIDFKPVIEFMEDINLLRKSGGTRKPAVTKTVTTPRGARSAADIIRDAQGRFSLTPAEPIRKPKVDWKQNPDNPAQLLRTEDGVVPPKPDTVPSNAKFVQDPEQPNRYVRQEPARSRLQQPAQSAYGFAGGVEMETDENGNPTGKVSYNPEKGMAGFFAAGAINSKGGRKILSEVAQNITKSADDVKLETKAPETPDEFIASARKQIQTLPEEPKATWREAKDRFYTDWVNRFYPIEKAVDAVIGDLKVKGAELRPEANPKYQIRRFLGMGGIAESKFQDEVRPVLDQLDEQGIDKLDMDAYLKARRDINLGERGIFGSDPVQAQQTVEAFEAKYGAEKLQPLAQQLYTYQNKLFDELTDAGFIKSDVAARIKATNSDYVPFERVMDDAQLDEFLGIPTKKVVQGTNPADKRIKGSERDIYSPIESIIANTYKYTAAVEKNKVAQSVAKLQEIMPELGFTAAKESGADTIPVWVDGVKQHIKVGKDIADAAKGLNEETMNNVLKIMQLPAQILRSGATGQNPEFMIPNVIRDQFEASLYSNYGYVPFVDYFRGMAHLINKSRTGSDEIVDAWMKSGASQELSSMSGRKDIQSFFDKNTGKKGLFGWLGDTLDFMGKYSEQPTRLGLFEKALNKTGNTNIAMMESRDATLDFSRMGSKMKVANSVIPFLNVGIQGFDKLIREAKTKPGKTAVKVAIYGLAPQMMSTMYNLVNHPDEYAEIPQFEKDGNFVFVQGRNEDGTVNYYTIPKANSMQTFINPVESFLSYMAGTNKQSFGEFATAFLSGALPVVGEGSSLTEVGVRTVGSLTPQIIKPAAENLLNKSFFRYNANKQEAKEIVPYFMKDKAPGDQSYDFTPAAYKVIGKVLNVSPLQVQNLAEGYLAGYAKVPVQVMNLMLKASNGEDISPNEVTLMRRFAKQTYPTSETQQKKRQAPETSLIPQAGATDGSFKQTPEVLNSGVTKAEVPTTGEDDRNWFQKMFNIQKSDSDSEPEQLRIPSDDKGLEVMYKDAKSILDDYETKKIKYQYGRNTDPEGKLEELEADKAYAEQIMSRIEAEHPEKIADFEMKSYVSGAGANVDERAEWAHNAIKKLGESGDTDKLTAFIDKLWDEKVLTSGKSGVAQKILEEYGIDVFNYGKDPKKSSGSGSGSSKATKAAEKLAKENQKNLDTMFKAASKTPDLSFDIKTPKSQVNWASAFKTQAPVTEQNAEFSTAPKVAGAADISSFFRPTTGAGVSPQAAQAVAAVRGGGRQDNRMQLRYAGGRSR